MYMCSPVNIDPTTLKQLKEQVVAMPKNLDACAEVDNMSNKDERTRVTKSNRASYARTFILRKHQIPCSELSTCHCAYVQTLPRIALD